MKRKSISLFLLLLLLITSCGEDRIGEYEAIVADKKWIEDIMRDVYLWYEDIPDEKDLIYTATPDKFFNSLLTKIGYNGAKDGFSRIDVSEVSTKSISEESTYGFEFTTFDSKLSNKSLLARVLYVLPNSPASEAGLKRGDIISTIDSATITNSNKDLLISGDGIIITRDSLKTQENTWITKRLDTLQLTPSRKVEIVPFLLNAATIIDDEEVGRIGYFCYNHFSAYQKDKPSITKYNDEMINIFSKFQQEKVEHFVLDLRYNPGGVLDCAHLLGSLLAPQEALGKTFCSVVYNDKHRDQDYSLMLNNDAETTKGVNLNLKELYVITSSLTASASEVVINCLSNYMKVITIGGTTVGKSVASQMHGGENSEYPNITLYPIVAFIHDSKGEVHYKGITPKFAQTETVIVENFYPLGDPREELLRSAISVIKTGDLPKDDEEEEEEDEEDAKTEKETQVQTYKFPAKSVFNSLERRRTNGIILN